MACQIKYTDNGELQEVLAKNGSKSILFAQLLEKYNNVDTALHYWVKAEKLLDKKRKDKEEITLDANGELILTEQIQKDLEKEGNLTVQQAEDTQTSKPKINSAKEGLKQHLINIGAINKFNRILDLNKFRVEITRLSKRTATLYGTTGRLAVDDVGGTKARFDYTQLKKIDRARKGYYQLEGVKTPEVKAKPGLDGQIRVWMSKMGIDYRNVEEIRDRNGNLVPAIAKADMLHRIIEVVEGKAQIDTLSEEAAHFLVEMLGQDSQLYQDMMSQIENYPELIDTVYSDYRNIYSEEEDFKKEAVGKLIAREMVNAFNESDEQSKTWFTQLWEWVKNKISLLLKRGVTKEEVMEYNPFREAANIIIEDRAFTPQEDIGSGVFYQATQEEVVEKFKQTESNIKKIEDRTYFNNLTQEEVKSRVTDIVDKYWRSMGLDTDRPITLDAQKGSIVHLYMEEIFNEIKNDRLPNQTKITDTVVKHFSVREEFKGQNRDFYKMSEQQFAHLLNGAAYILGNIEATQKNIDPKGKAEIFQELVVYNEKTDTAGTIDLIVVFSDGSVSMYDFKTTKFFMIGKENYQKIGYVKEEAFNLQLTGYRSILSDQYDIDTFRETRVVPINRRPTTVYNKTTKEWKEVPEGFGLIQIATDANDPYYIQHIPVANELTGNEKLDEFLKKQYAERDRLMADIKNRKGDRDKNIERLQGVRDNIQGTLVKKQMYNIFREINIILADIEKNLNVAEGQPNHLDVARINDYLNYLRLYADVDKYTSYLLEDMPQDTPEQQSAFKEQQAIANQYASRVKIAADNLEQIQVQRLQKLTKHDLLDAGLPAGMLTRIFMGVADFDNPAFKVFAELIRNSNEDKRIKVNQFYDKFKQIHKDYLQAAKSLGYTGTNAFDLLIDDSGRGVVTQFTREFWVDKKKAQENKDYQWLRTYMVFDKEAFEKAKEKVYNRYEDPSLSPAFRQIERRKGEAESSYTARVIDRIQKLKEQYVADNNPEISKEAWLNKRNIFLKPNRAIQKSEYINSNWVKVQNNPAIKAYYEFYMQTISSIREMAGFDDRISSNFIPNIQKKLMQKIGETGLTNLEEFKESIVRSLEIRQYDELRGAIDANTGKPIDKIPLLYVDPIYESITEKELKKIEEDVAKEIKPGTREFKREVDRREARKRAEKGKILRSRDLSRSLLLFYDAVVQYDNLSKIEEYVEGLYMTMTRDGAFAQKSELTDPTGKPLVDKVTKKIQKAMNLEQSDSKAFWDFMQMHLYGRGVNDKVKPWLIAGREIDPIKLLNAAQSYLSIKALGLEPILAGASYIGAKSNYHTVGVEGMYYTNKNVKAVEQLWITRNSKFKRAIEVFQPTARDLTQDRAIELSATGPIKQINTRNIFALHRWGDDNVDNSVFAAMMHHYVIDNGKIKNPKYEKADKNAKTVWEAFNPETGNIEGLEGKQGQREIGKFRAKAGKISWRVKGSVTPLQRALYERSVAGRMLMKFRTWMPGLFANRVGKLKYDEVMETYDWGRFPVAFRYLIAEARIPDMLGNIAKAMFDIGTFGLFKSSISEERLRNIYERELNKDPKLKITFEEFKALLDSKFRGQIAELRVLIGLISLTSLTASLGWDDKDRNNILTKNLHRLMRRSALELTFFYDKGSFDSILSSPIPVGRLLDDPELAIRNFLDESRDFIWGEDTNRDKTPMFYYTAKQVPGFNQGLEFFTDFFDR